MGGISDVIIKDHRELETYYNEVLNTSDLDHQERYGNQFVWELARHSVGEELVVYPAFEKYLGHTGKMRADKDKEEHHKVKELLKEFQKMKPKEYGYTPKLKEIWTLLSPHIEDEESSDLPALEMVLQEHAGESEAMANSFSRTKMFVPTRSHPSAGENPMFETAAGLMAAPMDRLADMFRKFPDNPNSANGGSR
ncbi:hypothetical protein EDB81DRAFT_640269 [Dactylonectria macrodidyma]|uniref:Hemerythrin-like domain-containing protein n=1 Tax=Dactylonectria macrodidyma TaxID=307937 RepID=A0A9P9JJA7_9HYPO|nr:hypothetical protein EDB81DRAFT_640269 [Dactylonectria macrodidyma]